MALTPERRRVFLSHTSSDKPFVRDLARSLMTFGNDIWLDETEIVPGDSIVTKVFEGLAASDTVVVVLSGASVESRWVKEELTSTAARRLVDQDVLLIPALIEDCEIPRSIAHLCYADFRTDFESGLSRVLDAIAPLRRQWATLGHLADHFDVVSSKLLASRDDEERVECLLKLHDLLESALDTRTDVETRARRREVMARSFFDKIEDLASSGIDVRSQTWNSLVGVRAAIAHDMQSHKAAYCMWVAMIQQRWRGGEDDVTKGVDRLAEVMRQLTTS